MFKLIGNQFGINRYIDELVLVKHFIINRNHRNHKKFGSIQCFSTNISRNADNADNDYDIVINGGGIVGFSTLLALKSSPLLADSKICLFEKQLQPNANCVQRKDNQFSNRVSSITISSKKFFQRIGVWNDLQEWAQPVKELYVWANRYRNAINFRPNSNSSDEDLDEDNDVVCYVIENNRILSALESKVHAFGDSVCVYGTVVTDVSSDSNGVRIHTKCLKTDSSTSLKTDLLVGSDGFDSIVRQKSNLKNFEHDLEQLGIVGTIAVETGEGNQSNGIAFQRFVPIDSSVIALLPLSQRFCSFVWSVPKESAKRLTQMSEHEFVDHMNDTLFVEAIPSSTSISTRLDELIASIVPKNVMAMETPGYSVPHVLSLIPESRAMFPFKLSTTLPYLVGSPKDSTTNNRIVLIGDAAHRVHPLAGQGLNLGIGDSNTLSECIVDRLARGETLFGDNSYDSKDLENCLFDFERKRQLKAIAMIGGIHSMQTIFSCVPTQFLTLFNSQNAIKQRIINFANN